MPSADTRAVVVRAPARLHLGFLDPAGTLGRRFGSVGLVIDGFECAVEVTASAVDQVVAATADAHEEVGRAAACLERLRASTGLREPLRLTLRQVLPAHAGFGSGTQLALAIGRAFVGWHGVEASTPTLAHWLGRGLRSGIGIGGFDQGGLLVDGGPAVDGAPAPVLARAAIPSAWRIVVVQDPHQRGLSGDAERRAIAALEPLARAQAADLCHQVLMRVLPGAMAGDFDAFAAGVDSIQQVLGEHFAPAQGGSPWSSAAVDRAMRGLRGRGAPARSAIGQSSWGPTGFAIVASEADAQALVAAARADGHLDPRLDVRIVAGRNRGAIVSDRRPGA